MSEQHTAYVYPGPNSTKVARCSCGWEGTPRSTAIAAIKDRDAHIGR